MRGKPSTTSASSTLTALALLPLWILITLLSFDSAKAQTIPSGSRISEIKFELPEDVTDPELLKYIRDIGDALTIQPGQAYSAEKVQQTVRFLYQREIFHQVSAYGEVSGKNVALRFLLLPKHKIAKVEFEGNDDISNSDLSRIAALREGDALYEEDLKNAKERIRKHYLRNGHVKTTIEAVRNPSDTPFRDIVVFEILEDDPVAIQSIDFGGDTYHHKRWLNSRLSIEIGKPMRLEEIRKAIKKLRIAYREDGFEEVEISLLNSDIEKWEESPLFTQGKIEIDIDAGKRIGFRFIGNRRYSPKELKAALKLDTEDIRHYGYSTLKRLEKRLTDFYVREGYLHCSVRIFVKQSSKRKKNLVFLIHEGKRVKLRKIEFSGSAAFDSDDLEDEMKAYMRNLLAKDDDDSLKPLDGSLLQQSIHGVESRSRNNIVFKPSHYARPEDLDADEVYVEEAYEEAVAALLQFYRSHGYLECRIEGPEIVFNSTGQRISLGYKVDEGPQTFVETLHVTGVQYMNPEAIAKLSGIRTDEPLNDLPFEQVVRNIRAYYADEGFIYALADISYTLSQDRSRAKLLIAIHEGPQVRVGDIVVNGLLTTREKVVVNELTFEPGDIYSPQKMEDSQRWLQKLGIFQAVTAKPWDPEKEEDVKNVVVSVIERKQGRFEVSGGLATDDGVRAGMLFVYRNLFGSALEHHTRLKINHRIPALLDEQFANLYEKQSLIDNLEREISTGFYYPSIMGSHIGSRTDLIHIRRQERAYGLDKNSFVITFETELFKRLTLSQINEFSFLTSKRTTLKSFFDYEIIPDDGLRWEISPKLQAIFDYRDNLFNPTKGVVLTGLFEYFDAIAGEKDSDLVRGSGSISGYIPIPITKRPFVLRLVAKTGAIANISGSTDVDKRFKLGGRTSLRGFGEDAVYQADLSDDQISEIRREDLASSGGDAFLLFKADLRIPVYKSYFVGAFIDSGNLWLEPSNMDLRLDRYKNAAGMGMHYRTPVGDISLEIGWNLNPNERLKEEDWRFHFSISLF